LAVKVTPGQQHESTCIESVVQAVKVVQLKGRPKWRPKHLAGDKSYSYPRIRAWLRAHDIQAVIPQRSDQCANHRGRPLNFDRARYRQRNVIERYVGWLKENRRIAVRYKKLATNYLVMLHLAMIERYLVAPFPNIA